MAGHLPEILVCQIEACEGDLSEGMDLMERWITDGTSASTCVLCQFNVLSLDFGLLGDKVFQAVWI